MREAPRKGPPWSPPEKSKEVHMNALAATADIQIRGSPPGGGVAQQPSPVRAAPPTPEASHPKTTPEQEPPRAALEKAAEGVNAFLKSSGSHVQFALHEGTKKVMVEVVDNDTEEVVRTIPSKELLDLADRIGEMVGLFLDKKG
jgi:flagellar protein FlaG